MHNRKVIDLSHELHPEIPTWHGSCGFHLKITNDYDQLFRVMEYNLLASVGTHMDAPAHMIRGGQDLASLPLQEVMCPLCILDVTAQAQKNPGYQVSAKDVFDFEKKYGIIPAGSFVTVASGWDERWQEPERYRNVVNGNMVFPTFTAETAELLLERNISGIGIDTLSPDGSESSFPVHRTILGAGKVILENVANLKKLPATGATLIALPLKIKGGTESPVRAVGLLP